MPSIDWNHLAPIIWTYGVCTLGSFGLLWLGVVLHAVMSRLRPG